MYNHEIRKLSNLIENFLNKIIELLQFLGKTKIIERKRLTDSFNYAAKEQDFSVSFHEKAVLTVEMFSCYNLL